LEQLLDHTDKSLHLARERKRLAEQYIGLIPDDQIAREEYAASLLDLGHNHLYLRQPDTAVIYLYRAAELLKGYSAQRPDYWNYQTCLANVYFSLGEAFLQQGRHPQALYCYGVFGREYETFARAWPNTLPYRESRSQAWLVLGETYLAANNYDSASYCLAKFGQLAQEHYRLFSQWPGFTSQLSDSYVKIVNFLIDTEVRDSAFVQAVAGVRWAREASVAEPKLAELEALAAEAALLVGRFGEAELYAKAGLASDPAQSGTSSYLALAYLFQNDFAQARQVYLAQMDKEVGQQQLKVVFLEDLNYFAAQLGQQDHPNVQRARILLK
jgi:tetratricopeptide (TPR) repeat protein